MSQQTQRLWRRQPWPKREPVEVLRDEGAVMFGREVHVTTINNEQQSPVITLALGGTPWKTLLWILNAERLVPESLGQVGYNGHNDNCLTMTVDDCSTLADILDDDGRWSDTVTALRKALGLAGCRVEMQAGP